MIALLALFVLGGWSYDGFTSDPDRTASRPAPRPKPPAEPDKTPATPSVLPVIDDTLTRMLSRPAAPLWRLGDDAGQVWEHADRDWLRRWVDSRNASLRTPAPAAPVVQTLPPPPPVAPVVYAAAPAARVGYAPPVAPAAPPMIPVYRPAACPNGRCVRTP